MRSFQPTSIVSGTQEDQGLNSLPLQGCNLQQSFPEIII